MTDNNKFLLAHHLGMGDMIVLNGLVRHIYAREKSMGREFWLLCYSHNLNNVSRMYVDLDIKYLVIEKQPDGQPNKIGETIDSFDGVKEDLHLWGGEKFKYSDHADEAFFLNFGYDLKLYQQFEIHRGHTREKEVLIELVESNEKFIVIHDDHERGYDIKYHKMPGIFDKIEKGYKVIRFPKEIPMFDLLGVMEKAEECHFISSSFLCIALAYPKLFSQSKVFAHLYLRNEYLAKHCEKYGINVIL